MKKFILCSAIVMCTVLSACKENKIADSDVPAPAMAAFNAKYPGATQVQWITEKKDNKTLYEAQFKLKDKKIEAEFDADGTLVAED